jgi:hypothetical protein
VPGLSALKRKTTSSQGATLVKAPPPQGNYKRYPNAVASMNDTLKVMKGLVPTHITYNGKKGALTGKNAMTAKPVEA